MMYRFCVDVIVGDGHVRVDVFIYFLLIMWGCFLKSSKINMNGNDWMWEIYAGRRSTEFVIKFCTFKSFTDLSNSTNNVLNNRNMILALNSCI